MLVLGLYILIIFWIRHFKRWMGALLHRYEANKKCIRNGAGYEDRESKGKRVFAGIPSGFDFVCACHCVVCGEAVFLWDCDG